jgi:hypothetical protein
VRRATLILMVVACPAQAEVTPEDLLLAARCIGAEEARLVGADHIRPDHRQAELLAYAFSDLLSLPMTPPTPVMQAARKRGRAEAGLPPDAFASVEAIMAEVTAGAVCVAVIDELGLLPVVYPACFSDGCSTGP